MLHVHEEIVHHTSHDTRLLNSIWIELTNVCDLSCRHCYNNSGPGVDTAGNVDKEKIEEIILDAAALGCENIQFLGGEPTANKHLSYFINLAKKNNYRHIKVTTNATHITDELIQSFVECEVSVAVSIYSHLADRHDVITGKSGSHRRTVDAIGRMVANRIDVRANVLIYPTDNFVETDLSEFLYSLGVSDIHYDRVRLFGRAETRDNNIPDIQNLCGSCWMGILHVSANGNVSPCAMSSSWPVGSVKNSSLRSIIHGQSLSAIREKIKTEVWTPRLTHSESEEEQKKRPKKKSPKREGEPNKQPDGPKGRPEIVPLCSPTCQPYMHCLPD